MPQERPLSEVFSAFGDALKNDIRKVLPATVTAVDPSKQTIACQVAVHNVLFDDLGNVVQDDAPAFSNVPLACMRGGGFLVWLPVKVGDSVLLVFSDLSTDTWRAGDGNPQAPGWVGKHTMDSPFAIPAFAPDKFALVSPAAGKLIIGKDTDPNFQLVIDSTGAGSVDIAGPFGGAPGSVVPTSPGAAARVGDQAGPFLIVKGSTRVAIGG